MQRPDLLITAMIKARLLKFILSEDQPPFEHRQDLTKRVMMRERKGGSHANSLRTRSCCRLWPCLRLQPRVAVAVFWFPGLHCEQNIKRSITAIFKNV